MSEPPWDLWREAETHLDRALELDAVERLDYLLALAEKDSRLAREVEDLLAARDELGSFLDSPAAELFDDLTAEADPEVLAAALDAAALEEAEASWVGRELGPYGVLEVLGRGGMGEVYRAVDRRLGRHVAVKVLPRLRQLGPEARRRFEREARAVAALDHPNVCTLHDVGETAEGDPYLVMALYAGETLQERLLRGRLPPEEALDIALAVVEGLGSAHAAGIVHRDVKPANVMLTEGGPVKVLDFGIAKADEDDGLTRSGLVPGTPAYMAPEQLEGRPTGPAADIWALGVLLYEMLTGRRPKLREAPVLPAELARSPALAKTVERALEDDPEKRFGSVEALAEALRAARREWQDSKHSKQPRIFRRPGRAAALGLLSLVSLAIGGWWLLPAVERGRPDPETAASSSAAEASASTAEAAEATPVLRVEAFANRSGDSALDVYAQGVTRLLRDALSASRHVWVLGEAAGGAPPAAWVVTGEVLPSPAGYLLAARVRDVASGEQLAAERVEADSPAALYGAVDRLARAARRALRLPTEEAVDVFAADFASRHPRAYEHYLEGLEHFTDYRLVDAASAFEAALAAAPAFTMARFRLAQTLAGDGRTREALEHLRRAVAESSALDDREARYVRATAAYLERRYDDAIEAFGALVERYPYELEALHMLAIVLEGAGRREEALDVSGTLVGLAPERAVAWSLRGEILLALGRPAEAVAALERYLELEPGSANAHHLVGDAHRAEGQLELAASSYSRALEIDDSFHFATVQLAVVEALGGEEERALDRLFDLARGPEASLRHRLDATFEAVSILRGQGRFRDALELLNEASPLLAEEGVRGALGLSLRALCRLELGELGRATELAVLAAEDPPGKPYRYWVARGLVALASGEDAAFDSLVAALLSSAEDPVAASAAAWLSGLRFLARGEVDESLTALRRAVAGEGYAYAVYRADLATALFAAGRLREAEATARRAAEEIDFSAPRLDLTLDRRRARATQVRALLALGRVEEARSLVAPVLDAWRGADPGSRVAREAEALRAEVTAAGR